MAQQLVLVVDDDEDARLIWKTILESRGFAVVQAADGAEAVEIARRHRPALILLDLVMPHVDGWEVMELLRLDRRSEEIPVVAVTSTDAHSEEVREAGFQALLRKPVLPPQLAKAVEICVNAHSRGETWVQDLAGEIAGAADC